MYTRSFTLAALLGVCSVLTLAAADEQAEKRIADIIARLGAEQFEDREQATKELDQIGLAALEALRQATESPDPEIKKRALELVQRIEKRLESDKVLSATMVQINVKDAPIASVVADLARQTGYNIELADKANNRRVTLDTGKTTFWQALDKLCAEAGLKEQSDADAKDAKEKTKEEVIRRRLRPQQQMEPVKIVLAEGKQDDVPTCYAGAVRIRVLPNVQTSGNDVIVNFQVNAEPKVQWAGLPVLTIEKAVDDRGQELMVQNEQAVDPNMARNIMIVNGRFLDQYGMGSSSFLLVPVRFKGAGRAPGRLAEIKGSVSGPVQTPTRPLITVDNIAKQVGQTVKGAKGGSITVKEAARDDAGNFNVKLAVEPPPDDNAANNGIGVGGIGNRIQIAIAANGQAIVMPAGSAQGNLELHDAKGKKIPQAKGSQRVNGLANGNIAVEHDLVFRPEKDQEPGKLVYLGSQTSTITVPFTLDSGK